MVSFSTCVHINIKCVAHHIMVALIVSPDYTVGYHEDTTQDIKKRARRMKLRLRLISNDGVPRVMFDATVDHSIDKAMN